ncbi:hypothetical protein Tco_0938646 [Tanacetum coccineum]|uniref:Transposase (Putative), gypsy type n=1 Tax=Tanacetum coccineum TaxID=301880 RepID=A0ABQ5DHT1_9ASTR
MHLILVPSEFVKGPCTREQTPLILSWELIPRLDSGVRGYRTTQTAVSTITQEYLLEFTSEYGISEDLHSELPDRGDRIVDFSEGKIHLSQLLVIGAAKVSHFEIQCRVLRVIPSVNLFRVFYIPSYNSGWMSFSKRPGKNTPQCYTKPLDSLKNWNNRFFWVDERVFPTVVAWRTSAPKDSMPLDGTYSVEDVAILNARRTPIQKQPETLLCLVGLSRRYFLGDDVYPIFLHDDGREMDLFNLISAPNPAVIKTGTRPCTAHEGAAPNIVEEEETATDAPLVSKRRRKRANEESNANAPRKETPTGTMNLDPISFAKPSSIPEQDIAQSPREQLTAAGGQEPDPTPLTMACHTEAYTNLVGLASGDGISAAVTAMEGEKKNLETLLEAEADIRKAVEAKNAELVKEMESLHAQFTELQVSRNGLSHQVSTLQALVTGEEKIKAAFEEFKKYKDERVSAQCAEMDSRLDAFSIDFDEELYLHMLTDTTDFAMLYRRDTKGVCDGLNIGGSRDMQKLDLALVEGKSRCATPRCAYGVLIFGKSATGRTLPNGSAVKEEMLLEDAIAANVSRAEKKKKCRIVCRTHGVVSAHHTRSNGVPVSVPTAVPQGLVMLLADAATQTDVPEEESSPKLTRSKSLPSMYNLDWL